MNIPDFIPDFIRNISSLDLTVAGMIDLLSYPAEAIQRANVALMRATERNGKPLDAPFKYFAKVAYNYCKDNNIQPDWGLRREKAEMMGIKDNDPRVHTQSTIDTAHGPSVSSQSNVNTVPVEKLDADPFPLTPGLQRTGPKKPPPFDNQNDLPF